MTLVSINSTVAYFSMEICLEQAVPTYSGGLGVLAGDTLRSAADLGVPMVGITLLHRKGYFEQHLDAAGAQTEQPVTWQPDEILDLLPVSAIVQIEGRPVRVRAWRYIIRGVSGHEVPVFLLDTAVPENTPWDQTLTDYLYGGDSHYRLCQEVVLGMGGAAILRALGYNGVLMKHREVSQGMFPRYPINSITNGVHASTWTSPAFQSLFDRRIPEWRADNYYLRYAIGVPLQEIRQAHADAKHVLLDEIKARSGTELDPKVFTIGFARRATPYKRADLVISNPERLLQIADAIGPIQIVFGGKAHPHDVGGKELVRRIHEASLKLADAVKIVYVENYEMEIAAKMVAGVDLWLNNPMKPLEASGTSGMKAALNGVPSLSVLDGWWIEGHIEGVTGWSIGTSSAEGDQSKDASDLFLKLERVILPLFYGLPFAYADVLRSAIALNGSFFNTQRMVEQYVRNAYFPAASMVEETVA